VKELENHRRVLGILHLLWVGFAVVLVGAATVFIAASGMLGDLTNEVWVPVAVSSTIAAMIMGMIVLFFLPSLIGGYGILRGRPWARYWLMIAAVLNLLVIPFGTALAIYTLWVTLARTTTEVSITGT
jgi:hypothetical protein